MIFLNNLNMKLNMSNCSLATVLAYNSTFKMFHQIVQMKKQEISCLRFQKNLFFRRLTHVTIHLKICVCVNATLVKSNMITGILM